MFRFERPPGAGTLPGQPLPGVLQREQVEPGQAVLEVGRVLAESAVALGGAALLQTARRRVTGPPGAAAAGPDRAPHWPERAVLAVLVATGSVLSLGLATQPITEYDSLAYHLPVMAKWYQTGSLTN